MFSPHLLLVLHAHLPYVRHPEHAVSVEEHWLFDAMADCYLPLLDLFQRLLSERVPVPLALSVSPTLITMLEDPYFRERFSRYLEERRELCLREDHRLRKKPAFHPAIRMYERRFGHLHRLWHEDFRQDLVSALKAVSGGEGIELLTTGATHGFLPYLQPIAGAARAQIGIGMEVFERSFGERPAGFWLPECGYEPELEAELVSAGIRYTFLEGHGVLFGNPAPVGGPGEPVRGPRGVVMFPRHTGLSGQVWSAGGYPGDPAYREYYRDIGFDLETPHLVPQMHPDGIRLPTGLKYYRITGIEGPKEPYDPVRAGGRVACQARHFLETIRETACAAETCGADAPVLACAFDAELFGHWWFEGIQWLETVLRGLARDGSGIRARTPSRYLRERPGPLAESSPVASSWGDGGFGRVWLDHSTDWIWRDLHEAGDALRRACEKENGEGTDALESAAREILLAQSSDWPFMVSRNRTARYARRRVDEHLGRFWKLLSNGETGTAAPAGAGAHLFRHIPCIPFFRSADRQRGIA